MPPQQQLYNGLARPADYCIFCTGMDCRACGLVHVGIRMYSPAQSACWATAVVGGWPIASLLALLAGGTGQTSKRTDSGTDNVKT